MLLAQMIHGRSVAAASNSVNLHIARRLICGYESQPVNLSCRTPYKMLINEFRSAATRP